MLKTVAGANFPSFPLILPLSKKALLSAKSELKIKEYVCQVSSKLLKNCGLLTGTVILTYDERINYFLSCQIGAFASSVNGDMVIFLVPFYFQVYDISTSPAQYKTMFLAT